MKQLTPKDYRRRARELYGRTIEIPSDATVNRYVVDGIMYVAGWVKVRVNECDNLSCETPFFFPRRRDQLYCSPACAYPAKRQQKLNWWREHKGKRS